MSFRIKRIVLFCRNVQTLAKFYRDIFALDVKGDPNDKAWVELAAGECSLALHKGTPPPASRGLPKVVFWTADVAKTRETLAKKGAQLGKVKLFGDLHLCDGTDPEGNVFQLSNRP
jgi:predicted enzyme related to lactoylglutathione lyase